MDNNDNTGLNFIMTLLGISAVFGFLCVFIMVLEKVGLIIGSGWKMTIGGE